MMGILQKKWGMLGFFIFYVGVREKGNIFFTHTLSEYFLL